MANRSNRGLQTPQVCTPGADATASSAPRCPFTPSWYDSAQTASAAWLGVRLLRGVMSGFYLNDL